MAKDKQIIISTPSAANLLKKKKIFFNYIISTQYKNIIKVFFESTINKVVVYDITTNNNYNNLEKIPITDHINKTGLNPLINNSGIFKNQFIDIAKLYNKENIKETTTTCYGEKFFTNPTPPSLTKNNLPSTHLCNIAILCKALGARTVRGVLINSTKLFN